MVIQNCHHIIHSTDSRHGFVTDLCQRVLRYFVHLGDTWKVSDAFLWWAYVTYFKTKRNHKAPITLLYLLEDPGFSCGDLKAVQENIVGRAEIWGHHKLEHYSNSSIFAFFFTDITLAEIVGSKFLLVLLFSTFLRHNKKPHFSFHGELRHLAKALIWPKRREKERKKSQDYK